MLMLMLMLVLMLILMRMLRAAVTRLVDVAGLGLLRLVLDRVRLLARRRGPSRQTPRQRTSAAVCGRRGHQVNGGGGGRRGRPDRSAAPPACRRGRLQPWPLARRRAVRRVRSSAARAGCAEERGNARARGWRRLGRGRAAQWHLHHPASAAAATSAGRTVRARRRKRQHGSATLGSAGRHVAARPEEVQQRAHRAGKKERKKE
jgi:hypothetical protein